MDTCICVLRFNAVVFNFAVIKPTQIIFVIILYLSIPALNLPFKVHSMLSISQFSLFLLLHPSLLAIIYRSFFFLLPSDFFLCLSSNNLKPFRNKQEETLLQLAAAKGWTRTINRLLKNGAKINVLDKEEVKLCRTKTRSFLVQI